MTDHNMKFKESHDAFKRDHNKTCMFLDRDKTALKTIDSVPINGTVIDGIIIKGEQLEK